MTDDHDPPPDGEEDWYGDADPRAVPDAQTWPPGYSGDDDYLASYVPSDAREQEAAELRGHRDSRFVNDKVRAERQVQRFAKEHESTEVCILRFAPILGPTVSNMYTRFLSRPIAPVMMGHDPLMQFVHEQDAAWALKHAVDSHARGAFNIVGKGVLPYTTVLALLGRVPLPMPQLVGSPPSFLDFLLYLCVADGGKARRQLGFSPRLSIKRTILDFGGVAPEDGATDVARAQA